MKFAIYEDKTRPNDRLEEWVLYYDYHTDESTGQRTVSQVSLAEEVHGRSITISQAKRALGRFIADMAHVCTECLPELPPVVRVTIELDMNGQAPSDYCPPGLVSYAAENTRFADTEDWECCTRSVAKMDAGHHEVKLKVNYLTPRHDDVSSIVPSRLPCTKEVLDAANVEASFTATVSLPNHRHRASQETTIGYSHTTHAPTMHPSLTIKNTSLDGDNACLASSSRKKTQVTQASSETTAVALARYSSADMQVKDQLARMVTCHVHNTDFTNFYCKLPPSTKNTDIQATQTRDSDQSADQPMETIAMVYSRAKLEELDRKHFPLSLNVGRLKIVKAYQAIDEEGVTNCECGHGSEEGSMVGLEHTRLQPIINFYI
jgi:hypothetical protein